MTLTRRTVTIPHVVIGGVIDGASVTLPREPFDVPAISARPETDPPRGIMQHPRHRNPLVDMVREALR